MSLIPAALVLTGLVLVTASAAPAPNRWPEADWPKATPQEAGLDSRKLEAARDYALTAGGSGCILRSGLKVLEWGDQHQRFDLKSTTKSFGVTALGLALKDGKLKLEDRATDRHPEFGIPPETNRQNGWLEKITLRRLANQTAGFEKPGGYTRLLFEPGTRWDYSDSNPNWLAECITLAYRRDVSELMWERVFTPIGIRKEDLVWRKNAYRPAEIAGIPRREFGAGVLASVDAMARLGYLYLRNGRWKDKEILSPAFIEEVRKPDPSVAELPVLSTKGHGNASRHYGLLWWNNGDGALPGVPRDAYWSWGLYDSLMIVIPSLDLVIARAGPAQSWKRTEGPDHYDVLKPFLRPICEAVKDTPAGITARPAYPPSPVIAGLDWAPASSIVRAAKGSDNWPLTWGDDDRQYSAYGDGNGFDPRVPEKLSLGFVAIEGPADGFTGKNVRSASGEQKGDGARGRKASGMLMVDGTLYMWVRNAGNSQLAWSANHGQTWAWSEWKWTASFGCPTFLNFGKNYQGARDGFVYVYSQDADSAYTPADRMVLARVPKEKLREQSAYRFFQGLDGAGNPRWTANVTERGAVFQNSGACYRSAVTYCTGLKRYLWVQIIPGGDTRYEGGFAVYDAPEPWGPWTTAYFTERWDVGPGESASFPVRWMSADGKTLHLVFSGDDSFSVRKAVVRLR